MNEMREALGVQMYHKQAGGDDLVTQFMIVTPIKKKNERLCRNGRLRLIKYWELVMLT